MPRDRDPLDRGRRGRVDAAAYSRPHVFDVCTVAFMMRERLTHDNLGQNPHAAYLFLEEGSGLAGIRLSLRKLREQTDHDLTAAMTRRLLSAGDVSAKGQKFLVTFAVGNVLPLVGGGGGGTAPCSRPGSRFRS